MKVGLLGGGHLARMLALAGHPLGITCRVFDPNETCSASVVAEHVRADFGDRDAIAAFAKSVDVVTYERENIPIEAAELCAAEGFLHPNAKALGASQDRIQEKKLLADLGVPVARTHPVSTMSELVAGVVELGLPCILKTRRPSDDGRRQFVLKSEHDVQAAWDSVGRAPSLLESFVPFERELAMTLVRDSNGQVRAYPLVETVQRHGMLYGSHAPAIVDERAVGLAYHAVTRLAEQLDYVGVLTVEFFLDRHGYLIANEITPRVHDSAHWTLEGAVTSQFENHLRAITGLPLGLTDLRSETVVYNVIGKEPAYAELLGIEGARLHSYGKSPAPGRKLGHVSLSNLGGDFGANADALERLVAVSNVYRN